MKQVFEKIGGIVIIGALSVLTIAVVSAVDFLLLSFLGFEYESFTDLILFFLLYAVLDMPVTAITDAAPKVLRKMFGWRVLTFELVNGAVSLLVEGFLVWLSARLIGGVTIPMVTVIFFSVISYTIEWGINHFGKTKTDHPG